ncbi:hypothetical protein [Rheinheimera fenheensis]|uniref:hypothetical protein n=1 Tax=Rheinheimera fenheensis TaxID=3152295 RepID=UPI00325DF40E
MQPLTDPNLSLIAMYALTALLFTGLLVSGIAAIYAISKAPDTAATSLKAFFDGGNALKILTVFAVLVTAAFLALAGQLSEAAIALLSSIGGYVLGALKS